MGATYIFSIINFSFNILLMAFISPKYFGEMAIVLSLIGFTDLLLSFGIATNYFRSAWEPGALKSSAIALSINSVFAIVSVPFLYVIINWFYDSFIAVAFLLVYLFRILANFSMLQIARLEKTKHFTLTVIIRGAANSLGFFFALGTSVYYDMGLSALVLKEIVYCIVIYFVGYLHSHVNFKLRNPYKGNLFLTYKNGSKLLLSRFAELFYFKGLILIPSVLLTKDDLGIFSRALFFILLLNALTTPLVEKLALYNYSRAINTRTRDDVVLSRFILRFLFLVSSAYGLLLFGQVIDYLLTFVGEEWLPIAIYLRYLFPFYVAITWFNLLKQRHIALKREFSITYSYFASALYFVIFIIYMHYDQKLDLRSVCVITSSSSMVMLFVLLTANRKLCFR